MPDLNRVHFKPSRENRDRETAAPSAPAPARFSLILADADAISRHAIAGLLRPERDLRIIATVGTGRGALEGCHALEPDLLLLDLLLPDIDSMELIERIRRESSHVRIVILAPARAETRAREALRAGAQAYVLKELSRKDLVRTVRIAQRQWGSDDPRIEPASELPGPRALLSTREIEVLSLVAIGHCNRAIAARLTMREETVKGCMKNILSKLQARDRTHAVVRALQRGIIRLG